jgi:hypothetical protein
MKFDHYEDVPPKTGGEIISEANAKKEEAKK